MSRTNIRGGQIEDESIDSVDIASGSIKQGELHAQAVSNQPTIDSVDTTNDYLLIFDSDANALKRVAPTNLGVGGSGSPGGSDTQVQFNDGSSFGGDSGLTYNKTTNALTTTGRIAASLGFSGSLTRLVDGTSYLVGGNNITVNSGSNGQVTIESAGGVNTAALQIVDSPASGDWQTMTAIMPPDDTVPQNTEGTQILSASLTPLNSDSKLLVNITAQYTMSTTNVVTVALFRDSGASAIATVMSANGGDHMSVVNFSYVADSNATTSTEFKVRIGPSGGTLTFQGYSGGGKMGGTLASNITVTEILSGTIGTGADRAASYLVLAATSSLLNERVITAGTGITATDAGAGGAYTLAINDTAVATISGSTFTGDVKVPNLYSSGIVTASLGFSGSLTKLIDGNSYLAAGSNVTITSASNGQVTIASSGGGSSATTLYPIFADESSTKEANFTRISTFAFDPSEFSGTTSWSLEAILESTSTVNSASLRVYNFTDSATVATLNSLTTTGSLVTTTLSVPGDLPSSSKIYEVQLAASGSATATCTHVKLRSL